MKLLHTCIRVQNLEQSIEFYKKALKMHITRRKDVPEDKFTLVYLSDDSENHEIELTYNYDHGPYELGDGYSHMAFGVEDLEATHQMHKEMGYSVTDMYGIAGNPPNIYFITDPDGYEIEIVRLKK